MKMWKVFRVAAWICFAVTIVVAILDTEQTGLDGIFLVISATLMLLSSVTKVDGPAIQTAKDIRRKAEKEEWEKERQQIILDNTVVSAKFISSKVKKMGVLRSAALGTFFGGPIGAALFTHFLKDDPRPNTATATFSVKYASGRTEEETVKVKSKRFEVLCEKLEE